MQELDERKPKKHVELLATMAEKMGIGYVELEKVQFDRKALALLTADFSRRYFVIPFALENPYLHVAMLTPDDLFLLDEIRAYTGKEVKPFLADGTLILRCIESLDSHFSSDEHAACSEMADAASDADLPELKQYDGSNLRKDRLSGILSSLSRRFFSEDRIGLDNGCTHIKMAHTRKGTNGSIQLLDYAILKTPEGCIRNGALSDTDTIARELQKIMQEHRLEGANVQAVISANPGIRSKILTLKKVPDQNLEVILHRELSRQVPSDMAGCRMFYRITREWEQEKQQLQRVLATLVPNEVSAGFTRILHRLNLEAVSAETPFTAVSRFFNSGIRLATAENDGQSLESNEEAAGAVAVVDLGSETTNLSVISRGMLDFCRVFLLGGRTLDGIIAAQTDVSPGKAEEYKKRYGLEQPLREEEQSQETVQCIRRFMGDLLKSIKGSLDFYTEKCDGDPVKRMVFIGGGAAMKGLCRFSESMTGIAACKLEDLALERITIHETLDRDKLHYLINAIGITI